MDAKYLPLKIAFDLKRKRIHPTILKDAKWITVCRNMDKKKKDKKKWETLRR